MLDWQRETPYWHPLARLRWQIKVVLNETAMR